MNVLILTQYYLPENPPGAHRLSSLAASLSEAGHQVEVITAFPNYPALKPFDGYKVERYKKEIINSIPVHRSYIYLNSKKRLIDRLFSFISFQLSSLFVGLTKVKRPDVVICLSPPIFTCFTGVFLKWWYRSKLILNIADLWPESGVKLGILKNKHLIKLSVFFEEFFYNRAEGIACQTMGILNNIKPRTKTEKLIWFRNGVDFSYYENIKIEDKIVQSLNKFNSDLVIGYAGLVGYAQGMKVLVNASVILKEKLKVTFLIVGEGPKLQELKNQVKQAGLNNFIFTGNQPKYLMPSYLSSADVTIVPLIKTDLYLGALPSKIFDSFAIKKSVILGVDGEARELFVDKYECAYFYEPDNAESLAKVLMEVSSDKTLMAKKGLTGYEVMQKEFNRKFINQDIIKFTVSIVMQN
jgi:glycosyltransferase involved in cell wall biosynthesis